MGEQDIPYQPAIIEEKWQRRWDEKKVFQADVKAGHKKKKFYVLEMFPYPSGRLHMGHVRNYSLGDAVARVKMGEGYNVLHPMGWDAFGLPAENAAIKNKTHPEEWTLKNIAQMRAQIKRLGFAYDWSKEIATCMPEYYRHEQRFFIKLFEKGLAYRKGSTVNWCPSCATVLANEQVVDGACWRCDSETTTRELEQWFLRTTKYAEELLAGLNQLTEWPERVTAMQRHWIGKSEGARIRFKLEQPVGDISELEVFTTRPDTLFGVTYLAIAAEHPLAALVGKQRPQVADLIQRSRKQSSIERTSETAEKLGAATDLHALHPLSGERIPIYVANFVLLDYGTGALMAVPAHDTRDHAFAVKYKLPIKEVISGGERPVAEAAHTGPGSLVASGAFDGLASDKAAKAITETLAKAGRGQSTVQYRMRDWGLSRQRYWGTPIPMVHCKTCGVVPVPESELPVVLPKDVDLSGEGGSPLERHPTFSKTQCPTCRGEARRETDTMDTFMESNWYYLRFTSPHSTQAFDPEAVAYWLGVDQYIGGIEHATMHLLYARFFHKALRDLGELPESLVGLSRDEPFLRLLNQGIVYKDGAKMSKSKGNVVEPDVIVDRYGADSARLFMLFAAPTEKVLEWSDQGVEGLYRFLGRVWRLAHRVAGSTRSGSITAAMSELTEPARRLKQKTHTTISKVRSDLAQGFQYNTAIAALMELTNEIYTRESDLLTEQQGRVVLREATEALLRLLHPFAPHVTEELWEHLGNHGWLVGHPLPDADPAALVKDRITVVVQVNGKLRGQIEVPPNVKEAEAIAAAEGLEGVQLYLQGKERVRTVFVPGRLLNFVVKG